MAMVIIHHPQSRANLLRELLRWDPAVRRTGIRLVKVEGTDDAVRILVRKGGRTVRLGLGADWRALPLERLRQSLRAQLMALAGDGARRVALRRRRGVAPFRPSKVRAWTSAAKAPTAWLLAPGRHHAPVMAGPRGPPEPEAIRR